jgi:hypothetical protein
LTDLRAKTADVINATTSLSNARIQRDEALYATGTGLIETARDVKYYVKSIFGATSPQYKQVSALRYTRLTTD